MIGNLLAMQNQFRVFHWQTNSYAQHKAFGKAYESLDPLIDNFVEVFQGKKGIQIPSNGFKLKLENLDSKPEDMLDVFIEFLTDDLCKDMDDKADSDLLNIRDEMLSVVNQTKYLLLLK